MTWRSGLARICDRILESAARRSGGFVKQQLGGSFELLVLSAVKTAPLLRRPLRDT